MAGQRSHYEDSPLSSLQWLLGDCSLARPVLHQLRTCGTGERTHTHRAGGSCDGVRAQGALIAHTPRMCLVCTYPSRYSSLPHTLRQYWSGDLWPHPLPRILSPWAITSRTVAYAKDSRMSYSILPIRHDDIIGLPLHCSIVGGMSGLVSKATVREPLLLDNNAVESSRLPKSCLK